MQDEIETVFMIPKVKKELVITESSIKFKRVFFLLILLSTVLYFLFLVCIDVFGIKNVKETSFPLFEDFLQILIFLSIIIVLFVHLRLIPKVRKIKEPFHRFNLHIVIFLFGVQPFGLFGLFLGLIGLFFEGSVNWLIVCIFFAIGFLHSGLLYFIEIGPTLRACEVGKTIPIHSKPQSEVAQNIKKEL
ncbi:MAG: hypothetical protein ACFE95_06195 [Candidatus Hodarchaeota archaeon]